MTITNTSTSTSAAAKGELEYPQLRHATILDPGEGQPMRLVVGNDHFELDEETGERAQMLAVKRRLDGRHSIQEIADGAGVPVEDIRELVRQFDELGLLRRTEPVHFIASSDFASAVEASCQMWGRQLGYHALYAGLEKQTLPREALVGLVLETYHYVKSASRHIATAIAHCDDPALVPLLSEYFVEEHDHSGLMLEALERLGMPREWVETSNPLIGTSSLINMLCDIARRDTIAYLACTVLFEARAEDAEEAAEGMSAICTGYGWPADAVEPLLRHMRMDVDAGHVSLLRQALEHRELMEARLVHRAVDSLHDLKHSFDQFHEGILQWYSDPSNSVPRVHVDYFCL